MTENGVLEDFGALIGYEATTRLCALLGPAHIYIPDTVDANHPITRIVGENRMKKLVEEMGGQTTWLPGNREFERLRQLRQVVGLISEGVSTQGIAATLLLSERQIHRIRIQAEELGLLPMIITSRSSSAKPL